MFSFLALKNEFFFLFVCLLIFFFYIVLHIYAVQTVVELIGKESVYAIPSAFVAITSAAVAETNSEK